MEKDNKKVSVIIASLNREKLIKRAIDSVLAQNYLDFEIIVVDDCSLDNTGETVKSYNDSRIIYVRNETNCSAAKSRNIGIAKSTGRFISFLDSDDEWLPSKLSSELKLLEENPECAAVSFNQIFIDDKNKKIINRKRILRRQAQTTPVINQGDVLRGKSLSTNDFTARREILFTIGGFDEDLPARQDWDIWIRITGISPVVQSSLKMTKKYIFHGEQISTDINKKIKGTIAILNKHKNLFLSDKSAGFRIYLIIIILYIFNNKPDLAKFYLKESAQILKGRRKKLFFHHLLSRHSYLKTILSASWHQCQG